MERGDVFRVRYAGIRKKRALWGVLIGAVAGGAAMWGSHNDPDFGVVFGLGAGAIVGGALPIGPPLYEAEKVVRKEP